MFTDGGVVPVFPLVFQNGKVGFCVSVCACARKTIPTKANVTMRGLKCFMREELMCNVLHKAKKKALTQDCVMCKKNPSIQSGDSYLGNYQKIDHGGW
jgi:hypothetical protein